MLRLSQRRDPADAHQPAEEQPRDLLGPGDRRVQDVAPEYLQADDAGLRGDQPADRRFESAIDRRSDDRGAVAVGHASTASSQGTASSARASRCHNASAAGRQMCPSISRMVIPAARSPAVAAASSIGPRSRW